MAKRKKRGSPGAQRRGGSSVQGQRVRILLKSLDHKVIGVAARQIIEAAERTGSDVKGPIPLPTDVSKHTVIRSPFTGKDSREQFKMRTHKRLIDVLGPTPKTVDALTRLNLPAGVDIELKLVPADHEPPSAPQPQVPVRRVDAAGMATPDPVTPVRPSPVPELTEPGTSEGGRDSTGAKTDGRSHGRGGQAKQTSQVETGQPPGPPIPEPTHTETAEYGESFAKKFFESQTTTPSDAPEIPLVLPPGDPKIEESARSDTQQSAQFGRSGTRIPKTVIRWQPTEAARKLADEFRSMVRGDYGRRCQICGTTFKMSNGELQVFVVHIVPPRRDHRTNNFGNLVGLCGRHYALVRYGEWGLCDPETREPCDNWEHMQESILRASAEIDDEGNPYVGLPVRFWNIYQGWESTPGTVVEEICYSIPHWKYLRELLST